MSGPDPVPLPDAGLPDAPARRRIAEDLDHSLVVVAGAGTGKTTALVGRVVERVRRGASLRDVAVITFTESAAAELRARLSEALVAASAADPSHPQLRAAVSEVDEAAVCTLHAFAQRMLVEHVLAAGLPPGFEVLDELAERVDLEERLARFTDELLDDPEAEPMLLRGFVLGLDERAISELAWCLHRHWDRLDDGGQEWLESRRLPAGRWPAVDASPVVAALDSAIALAPWCTAEDDLLLGHLRGRVQQARDVLAAAAHDEQAVLPLLVRLPLLSSSLGKADNWSARVAEVRAACAAAEEARQAAIDLVRAPVLADLLARLGRFTLASATERAAEGRLSFHDLLVRARRLLRHDAGARAVLRARYRWLLVDEFQDTDPIQVDLAGWLASAVEGDGGFDRARPGALFVVGDPKQSIYRFRRADIALFEQVCADVGDEVVLSASFRSVPGIVRFVNTVFPSLFGGDPQPGQARYHALEPIRGPLPQGVRRGGVQLTLAGMGPDEPEPPGLGLPPVVVLGGPLDASIGEVRRLGASEVATALHRAVAQSWPVSDPDDPSALPRALRWRDVAVLIPARNFLPALEEAFDDAGIPFRLEGAALLWGADDVRDVLGTLAAADEPSDALSVLAALRSPGLACGDDDLVAWHAAGGSWDPRAPAPDAMDGHPVARAMAVLLELHRRRWWSDPSEMVTAAADALGSYALAFAQRRPRQHWQRLRWLADQARLFDETTRGSLHDFLRWAELQREGDGRAAILGPPEADDDAVRVMTVHGAKGLEFPLVVVAGLERDDTAGYRSDAVLWGDDGAVEVGVGKHLRSAGYAAASEADRAFDRLERVRLVYVAMTRARDHLVLCLHHKARSAGTDRTHAAQLDELCRQHPLLWRRLPEADVADAPEGAGGGWGGVGDTELDEEVRQFAEEIRAWSAERAATLARLRGLPVVTATALGHGDDVVPGAVVAGGADVPEWAPGLDAVARRGAVGLEIGRAVHGALAVVDLASGTDASGRSASEVARQRAALHGVGDHADEVAAMVARALDAPAVRRAASRRHHKEVYLATALGHSDDEGVFEGFADLLVEDDDGLVVVDYKTDRIADARAFSALVERYGLQVAAYAEAAEAATGTQVVRCVLVFVGPSEVAEHVLGGDALSLARRAARNAMAQLTAAVV